MSLYDIIGDITEQNITKTETGDTLVQGVMLGIVFNNFDIEMKGRVCVTIPTRDNLSNTLKWARLAMPSSGERWGQYFMPEIGDQVLLAFLGGNIECPYIIGCIPKEHDKFLTDSADISNQIKRIVTKNGSNITFNDNIVGEGEMDKITISTPNKAHTIELDNNFGKISIRDRDAGNSIIMSTGEGAGNITIKAKNRLTIRVGDNIKLTLNGDSGAVKLEANSIKIETTSNIGIKTDGMLSLDSGQLIEKASSMAKIESSGMISIAGNPIKVG